MRKAVAEKFPAITSLRPSGTRVTARNGKENNPPAGSMELVVMVPPATYTFGVRSKHTVAPASSSSHDKVPAPLTRQVLDTIRIGVVVCLFVCCWWRE
jgi:hypothetical protein